MVHGLHGDLHGCSGVTYPYLMKEDSFSLRILHENILLLVCNDMGFFGFSHFSHGKIKVSVRSFNRLRN